MSWTLQSSCPLTGQSWTSCPWTLSRPITSTACNYITKSQQLCFSHSVQEQSRLSKSVQIPMVNPSQPAFQDKFNPTKKELKTLRRFETPLNKPKSAVSRRLGI